MTQHNRARNGWIEVALERDGDTCSILLSGELDASSAEGAGEKVRGMIDGQTLGSLVFDFCGLTGIDAAGLLGLRSTWESAREQGLKVILVRARLEAREAFESSGLDRLLPVVYVRTDSG